ncbi:MAG: L-glutamate gamma-semialdehyde dehydrogenase [Deltaproteobacteria bacterium]|nr:L-glutamate gamma-semialdehyde dehydrogenase [Deltaproteobacteria bacterium]
MINAKLKVPTPINEPIFDYEPGSAPRAELQEALKTQWDAPLEVPVIIGGKEIRTGNTYDLTSPQDNKHVIAKVHMASPEHVEQAAVAARKAWKIWSEMPYHARASVFLKAADLLAGPWRARLNASTIIGQSKTCHQAEIDAACELIDFLRFNAHYGEQLMGEQPSSSRGMWNYVDHRPLEGFVFAITPFNFTAIAGNLPSAPALMGNVILWKPASTQVHAGYQLMQLFKAAGLPDGVVNFLPGRGAQVGDPVLKQPGLAGVHFTGSTAVFQRMWRTIGENIADYATYPRIVGETGGKDFIVVHDSADEDAVTTAIIRGSFEFQGQKCSAASRVFLSESFYKRIKGRLAEQTRAIKMGDPADFSNFMGAVIDKAAFESIKGYIDYAKQSNDGDIVVGGECDDSRGWFIRPTVVQAKTPDFKLMREEIFGPVVTLYPYADGHFDDALRLCDEGSPYALTGAIFAQDRVVVEHAAQALRHTAGNFYINDKPTGAVVGQQPFGGGRASGTNDKAGSVLNLLRWVSPRTVKETFVPATDYRYPYMK